MASGRLGIADLAATTDTKVYTVPASTLTVASITICNRNSVPIQFRLAIAATDTPAASEFLEFDETIRGNKPFDRTGLVMHAGMRVVVRSSAANVNVVLMGIEEAA